MVSWDSAPAVVQTRTKRHQELNDKRPCPMAATMTVTLLRPEADRLQGRLREDGVGHLCAAHGGKYLSDRRPSACALSGCNDPATRRHEGVLYCEGHFAELQEGKQRTRRGPRELSLIHI